MHKFGDLVVCLGVFLFFLGGLGIAFGFIPGGSPLLPSLAALALVLIGIGAFLKKKKP